MLVRDVVLAHPVSVGQDFPESGHHSATLLGLVIPTCRSLLRPFTRKHRLLVIVIHLTCQRRRHTFENANVKIPLICAYAYQVLTTILAHVVCEAVAVAAWRQLGHLEGASAQGCDSRAKNRAPYRRQPDCIATGIVSTICAPASSAPGKCGGQQACGGLW